MRAFRRLIHKGFVASPSKHIFEVSGIKGAEVSGINGAEVSGIKGAEVSGINLQIRGDRKVDDEAEMRTNHTQIELAKLRKERGN